MPSSGHGLTLILPTPDPHDAKASVTQRMASARVCSRSRFGWNHFHAMHPELRFLKSGTCSRPRKGNVK